MLWNFYIFLKDKTHLALFTSIWLCFHSYLFNTQAAWKSYRLKRPLTGLFSNKQACFGVCIVEIYQGSKSLRFWLDAQRDVINQSLHLRLLLSLPYNRLDFFYRKKYCHYRLNTCSIQYRHFGVLRALQIVEFRLYFLKCTKGLAEKLVQSITSNLIEKKFSTNKGRQISSIKLVLFVILQAKLIYSDQILKSNEKSRIRQQNKVEFCFYCYET